VSTETDFLSTGMLFVRGFASHSTTSTGEFQLTIPAVTHYDHAAPAANACRVRLLYKGEQARQWHRQFQAAIKPGQPLRVAAHRPRIVGGELLIEVQTIVFAPRAATQTQQRVAA
jgi:hypothetical protein